MFEGPRRCHIGVGVGSVYDYRVERVSRALVTVTVISGVAALLAGLVGAEVIGSVNWVGGGIADP